MPVRPVAEFLDQHQIRYHCYNHPPADTAQEIAHYAHISGHELAKTVILNADGRFVMAVLPAHEYVELERLREIMGANRLQLAREDEFRGLFPWCEPGGEPPFGILYGLDVYMDADLMANETIAFNAGTHTEVMKMDTSEFRYLVHPKVARFSRPAPAMTG